MLSDPLADSLRGVLRQVYAGLFVPGVVRNPLVEWEREGEGESEGVDSDAVSGERSTRTSGSEDEGGASEGESAERPKGAR